MSNVVSSGSSLTLKWVGNSPRRKEGLSKVTGSSIYVDDLKFDDCLYGKTIRTTIPRGKIKNISYEEGIPWSEFTIVTYKDIPGENVVTLLDTDQPLLVETEVRHKSEPVLLIAHEDKGLVEKACKFVNIEYETAPAILTIDESGSSNDIQYGENNVFKEFHIRKGDTSEVWTRDGMVVTDGEYFTGPQEQLYIEPQGVAAIASKDKGVKVWGSMQCPYYIHKGLIPIFNLPEDKIRVVFTVTGGGFGGKEEYPTILAAHAGLLSWKSGGKPVKMIYDRLEDLEATTKRHPCRTRIKTAFTNDGKLIALEVDATMDGGAYLTLSPVVLSRGTLHAFGPYVSENVSIDTRAVLTNSPPYGAFRGFGAPQTIFALEQHMDKAANELGIEPHELRRRNVLKPGDTMATGQKITEDPDILGIMNRAMDESGYIEKRREYAEHNKSDSSIKKGIGMALFMHGAGFTGSGEVVLDSIAAVELARGGRIRILTANTEIGQGAFTTFSQIVSEASGIPYERIDIVNPDTADVPNSGPTVASRTCMVVGNLLGRAAATLKDTLVKEGLLSGAGYSPDDFEKAGDAYLDEHKELKVFKRYEPPPGIVWDDKTYQGEAYGAYAWACYIADIELDTITYMVDVKDFVAVQDVGRVVHPVIAKGQIEGGVAQAIGWALYENIKLKDGVMVNNQLTNYIIPTTADTPPIRVYFYENPYAYGPFGAKGLGELPMDGPAPAIASAVAQAMDNRYIWKIPIMPEDIMEKMEAVT